MEPIVKNIVDSLSIEEKARLVCGETFFGIAGIPRYDIPHLNVLDGGTGMNYEQLIGDIFSMIKNMGADPETLDMVNTMTTTELKKVINNYFHPERLNVREMKFREIAKKELDRRFAENTANKHGETMAPGCFPTGMLLGATWNPKVVSEVGHALGREARAHGINMLLGTPNINIHRDVLNGRLFEGFSEDPCLIAELAPELSMGVEAEGVASNIKHFAANNQETNRQGIDEMISERALREIYFMGFEACVKKAKPATFMSAYNKINGVACTENKWLLDDVLRKEWGFDGMVVSDWGAVYNQIPALKAGNDVNMPGPVAIDEVMNAINSGELTEEELTKNAARVVSVLVNYAKPDAYEETTGWIAKKSDKAAYDAACEGIVMLKNDNGIFPLDVNGGYGDSVFAQTAGREKFISLCGSSAEHTIDCGTGSAGITTDRTSDVYDSLRENGVNVTLQFPTPDNVKDCSTILCVAGVPGMEGNDRENMRLRPEDEVLLDRMVILKKRNPGLKIGLILNTCGPVNLMGWIDELDGLFMMFLPGMEGGNAMADILCGRVSPSGKLPLTFPKRYKDTPAYLNFPGDGYRTCYGEGIYVGYRYYDKREVEPLYPFGYGLSYCDFDISNMKCDMPVSSVDVVDRKGNISNMKLPVFTDEIRISVDVKNCGPADRGTASEVVQLYISDKNSTIHKPAKELKAFKKVRLEYGETKRVEFGLSLSDFAYFDEDYKSFVSEEGVYTIMIGNSSRNILCTMDVYLDTVSVRHFGMDTNIKTFFENKITRSHLLKFCDTIGMDRGSLYDCYEYEPSTKFKTFVGRFGSMGNSSVAGSLKASDEELKRALDVFLANTGALKVL